jgi:hypothetical protein
MAWRAPTTTDLTLSVSETELESYSAAATQNGETAEGLVKRGADMVRGYLRANGSVRLGPAGTVPEALIAPLMDYLCVDVIKRLPLGVSDDRRTARRQAIDLFKDAQAGNFAVESYGAADEASPAGACELASSSRQRLTPQELSGL